MVLGGGGIEWWYVRAACACMMILGNPILYRLRYVQQTYTLGNEVITIEQEDEIQDDDGIP